MTMEINAAQQTVPVLVVGGGTVGLTAAMALAGQGVACVLVERNADTPLHPRAVGWSARSLEIYRSLGIVDRFEQKPETGGPPGRVRIESLAGEWFEETPWTPPQTDRPEAAPLTFSPHVNARMSQDVLEPILRARAVEMGADVRFSTELLRFAQDEDGVTAWLRGPDGREYTLRSAWMVAADGHRSPVREALGIGRSGPGALQTMRSVMFRPQIPPEVQARVDAARARGLTQFMVDQPDLKGMLGGGYPQGRWIFYLQDDKPRSDAELKDVVRRALGLPDNAPEIVTTGRWQMAMLIADTFRKGRVFLAGDAAHALPPSRAGWGANTGIADVHNLAWKLAAVLSGVSQPALLDSYNDERRPVAWLRCQQIMNRPDFAGFGGKHLPAPIIEDAAMEFGQIYRSAAVIGAGEELPPALRPDLWAGQPGTRAPHLWMTRDGARRSTLDLFGPGWTLVAGEAGWEAAAAEAGRVTGVDLSCARLGAEDLAAFGLSADGASLVRPDGHVAWRSEGMAAAPAEALAAALRQAACLAAD